LKQKQQGEIEVLTSSITSGSCIFFLVTKNPGPSPQPCWGWCRGTTSRRRCTRTY